MGMKMYDLYLILSVCHSKGVALWVGDVYDYVILLYGQIANTRGVYFYEGICSSNVQTLS